MRRLAIVAALMAASPAVAQQTTRCGEELGKWVCRTEAPRQSGGVQYNFVNPSEVQERAREDSDAIYNDAVRTRVGRLIAAGRCDEARAAALKAGEMHLAGQVDQLCK